MQDFSSALARRAAIPSEPAERTAADLPVWRAAVVAGAVTRRGGTTAGAACFDAG